MTALPRALAPWAEALSILDPQLAVALGPLVRGLDGLMARHADDAGEHGEQDGYGGIGTRGGHELILPSEWLLADELPLEFLRRAASGELLHLAPERRRPRRRGRIAVVLDCGPDQLGAARLVQLAAIVVAHRRADAWGGELAVGVLGDEPGTWKTGALGAILPSWLRGRRARDATADDAADWAAGLDRDDELWVFCGPRLARNLPDRKGVLVATGSTWDDRGVVAVRVTCGDAVAELPVPAHGVAVKALRGAAFRGTGAQTVRSAGVRGALFPSADARLLVRGRDDSELVAVLVRSGGKPSGRPRTHRFRGPVVAAAHLGKRLVAAIIVGEFLRVEVVGKPLGSLHRIAIPLAEFDQPPVPGLGSLYYFQEQLVLQAGGRWWTLPTTARPHEVDLVAIAPGDDMGRPRAVARVADRLHHTSAPWAWKNTATRVLFGSGDTLAWSDEPGTWHLAVAEEERAVVATDANAIGVVCLDDEPALMTLSDHGLIVRAVSASGTRTLTTWSAGVAPPTLHLTRPWIVVQRAESTVQVGDLSTGDILLTLSGTT